MTSPTRHPHLPSVFSKPDDVNDNEPVQSSPRLKPWQKHRTSSSSGSRPRLSPNSPNSPTLKSLDPVVAQWASAERNDTIRLASSAPRRQELGIATAPGASEQQQDQRGDSNENGKGKKQAGKDRTKGTGEAEDEDEDEPAIPYPEVVVDDLSNIDNQTASLIAPPNFRPFFTVLEDSLTGEVYHPTTYYIFADDDPALITAASMRALGSFPIITQHPQGQGSLRQATYPESDLLPPPKSGANERYIIVDVGVDGQTITRAQSLSGGWAVTKSAIIPAPSFGGQGDDEEEGQTMMLKIDGLPMPVSGGATSSTITPATKLRSKEARLLMDEARKVYGGELARGMEEIVKGINKSVAELEEVVGEKM